MPREPRQRRPNIRGRTVRHVVKVTPEEDLQLQKLANDRSVTVARLMHEAATGTLPAWKNKAEIGELFGIRHELRKQGANLNQIALAANAERATFSFPDTDLAQTMRVIRELDRRLTAWLEGTDGGHQDRAAGQ